MTEAMGQMEWEIQEKIYLFSLTKGIIMIIRQSRSGADEEWAEKFIITENEDGKDDDVCARRCGAEVRRVNLQWE